MVLLFMESIHWPTVVIKYVKIGNAAWYRASEIKVQLNPGTTPGESEPRIAWMETHCHWTPTKTSRRMATR